MICSTRNVKETLDEIIPYIVCIFLIETCIHIIARIVKVILIKPTILEGNLDLHLRFGHDEIFICAHLSADPMIEMILTNPRCELHLLLQHVLVALLFSIKQTHLEEIFDHIASQSMYNVGFSSYSVNFLPPNNSLSCNVRLSTMHKIHPITSSIMDKPFIHVNLNLS